MQDSNLPQSSLLSGTCPQPTIGSSTFIFWSLIELALNSQPDIAQPLTKTFQTALDLSNDNFDFIIVGGGVAGSVLASRLSQNSNYKILLLEAGSEPPPITSVPKFAFEALDSIYDWKYQTVPQENACLSTGGICKWPRGKMLCGTACLSGLMYTRGHPSVYNSWSTDNDGWSYSEVLPFFKRSERNSEPSTDIEKEFHGFDGPLSVSRFPFLPRFSLRILKAAEELGYEIRDLNGSQQEGFSIAPIMVENGVLANPTKQYLKLTHSLPNLRILMNSSVTRILFNKKGTRAIGVEFVDRNGNTKKVKASKEVILSAGTVGSAQLLLLSGIGPGTQLQTHGIKVIRDLAVGENLHYHVGFPIHIQVQTDNDDTITTAALNDYIANREGIFASTGITQVTGFVRSAYADPAVPDIQIYLDGFNGKCRDWESLNEPTNITFRPIYLLSKCRGNLKLRSANPHDTPLINPNYLCNNEEIEILLTAIDVVRNLTTTTSLQPKIVKWITEDYEKCIKYRNGGDERDFWKCVITKYTSGENHHAGTCKMGPPSDSASVVDNKLRIHGMKNLRIVDASIFPTPINCNTIAPVIMIAEKAADLIKSLWR